LSETARGFVVKMLVKVRVTGNVWGVLGLFWPKGKEAFIDEKIAEDGVKANVMEIIERPIQATGKPKLSVR
jgi:hypothetical protein